MEKRAGRTLIAGVGDGSVLSWLLVTTTNLARNSRRAALRYRRLLASLLQSGGAPDSAGGASRLQDAVDQNVALALALRRLNATDLHLVSLVVFEKDPSQAAEPPHI